jgi:hypothetical protein
VPRKRKLTSQSPIASGADAGKAKLIALSDIDFRTIAGKRVRALIAEMENDLGGSDTLSAAQRSLIARAAASTALCEHMESLWLLGHGIDVPALTTLTNSLTRLLSTLGIRRTAKDVTPSLSDYVAAKAAAKAKAPPVPKVPTTLEIAPVAAPAAPMPPAPLMPPVTIPDSKR